MRLTCLVVCRLTTASFPPFRFVMRGRSPLGLICMDVPSVSARSACLWRQNWNTACKKTTPTVKVVSCGGFASQSRLSSCVLVPAETWLETKVKSRVSFLPFEKQSPDKPDGIWQTAATSAEVTNSQHAVVNSDGRHGYLQRVCHLCSNHYLQMHWLIKTNGIKIQLTTQTWLHIYI